jgi:SH3-like domain-containing protein
LLVPPAAATRTTRRPLFALAAFAVFAALATLLPTGFAAAQDPVRGTGLPLPRFVSLKSNDVNVRRGPGQEYDIAFTFVKEGLPVEITQEFDNWRKIRDSEGAEGWVFHSLLSGKRTALVAPWETSGDSGPYAVRAEPDTKGAVVAYLTPRVIAEVEECHASWCLVSGSGYHGWIEQERLWGVYPNEEFSE